MLAEVNPTVRRMPNLAPLTDKQIRDAERERVYVFNVSPREHRVFVDREYIIPARAKGEDVSEPLSIPGTVYTTGVKKVVGLYVEYEWIPRDGIDVAREIVGSYPMLDPSQNLAPFGLFISMSSVPSEDAIAQAKEKWLQTCADKVADGDRLASINNGIVDLGGGRTGSNIGKDHREALAELGLKRPWSGTSNQQMLVCEECGESNMPSAARCKGCRAVFDEAKARQRYPEMYAHEEPAKRAYVRKEIAN